MITASKLVPAGRGLARVLLARASAVALPWDVRQRSRFEVVDASGRAIGVFLPRGTVVRGGDVLVAEDGSLVRALACPEPVLKVTACSKHGTSFDLICAAYHLGNRHVPLELQPDHLKLERDPVLADMLRGMHLVVTEVEEPFEPAGGAYPAGGHRHNEARRDPPASTGPGEHHHHDAAESSGEHGHSHSHGHSHGHGHHDHAPASLNNAAHVHGPGCGHEH